jgi:hypothetical protein
VVRAPDAALAERIAPADLANVDVRSSAMEALTLGEAIWRPLSARDCGRNAGVVADLGRDQGRETALLDEAHLDG